MVRCGVLESKVYIEYSARSLGRSYISLLHCHYYTLHISLASSNTPLSNSPPLTPPPPTTFSPVSKSHIETLENALYLETLDNAQYLETLDNAQYL